MGSTATGKSDLALELARRYPDFEIVSIDAMQVYRGMDIGTAKPTAAERAEVPHHLIDLADPGDDYSLALFQAAARQVLADIEHRDRRALLVGGTGLYLRAVVDGLELPGLWPEVRAEVEDNPDTTALHGRLTTLDPVGAARMEPSNRRRIVRALEVTLGSRRPFSSYGPGLDTYPETDFQLFGLRWPLEVLDQRISRRFERYMERGLLDEVRALIRAPGGLSRTASQALGYRELASHLAGQGDLHLATSQSVQRTQRFARRQQRWFFRDPRIDWTTFWY